MTSQVSHDKCHSEKKKRKIKKRKDEINKC